MKFWKERQIEQKKKKSNQVRKQKLISRCAKVISLTVCRQRNRRTDQQAGWQTDYRTALGYTLR